MIYLGKLNDTESILVFRYKYPPFICNCMYVIIVLLKILAPTYPPLILSRGATRLNAQIPPHSPLSFSTNPVSVVYIYARCFKRSALCTLSLLKYIIPCIASTYYYQHCTFFYVCTKILFSDLIHFRNKLKIC